MTRVDVPERARYAARLMTVVVLPTPPFWFVQAVTLATGTPLRVQMGALILPVSPVIRGLAARYRRGCGGAPGAECFTWNMPLNEGRIGTISPQTRARPLVAKSQVYSCAAAKRARPDDPGGSNITYSSILLAILVGIAHAGLAPAVVVGGVKPNLVLVAVVLVTTNFGFSVGIAWAFLAGLVANLLIPEPLGSIPLALLVVAAIVSGGGRVLGRLVWAYPILAAFVGSIVADLVS